MIKQWNKRQTMIEIRYDSTLGNRWESFLEIMQLLAFFDKLCVTRNEVLFIFNFNLFELQ